MKGTKCLTEFRMILVELVSGIYLLFIFLLILACVSWITLNLRYMYSYQVVIIS